MCQCDTCIGSSNDDVRKNERKSDIACTHSSESKRKKRKKIEKTKRNPYGKCITCLCSLV